MASINELISKMSEKDIYSVLCGYLYELKNIPEFTLLSELAFTLDCDSFLQLINCFGGQTIKIPTAEEFKSCYRTLMLLKYYEIEHLDWKDALEPAGYQSSEGRMALNRLNKLKDTLKDYNLDRLR